MSGASRIIEAHRRGRLRRVLLVMVATIPIALGVGCAFFNTFYNARKTYRTAEEVPRTADGGITRTALTSYDKVIEKCEALIATYPDSKWVDDALLLMGKAHYRKSEYDLAIEKFEQLSADHPESNLLDENQIYLGKSYIAKDDPESAVPVLRAVFERNPKTKFGDEILYLLGTNLIKIEREAEALKYLEILADKHPNSTFRVDADLEIADLYLEQGDYEKSLAVFRKLAKVKLSVENDIRFYTKLAEAQVKIGRYPASLRTFKRLERYVVPDQDRASQLLFKGQALEGLDSLDAAIDVFETVASTYPRSRFSAEANYRLGVIYHEELDSLTVAKAKFDEVPRQYTRSPFAQEAIRRSVSLTRLQKLEESLDKEGGEDKAAAQFGVAEVQLFQLGNYQKALESYQVVLDLYPASEVAPKAAYAIAYLYGSLLEDEPRARVAYRLVVERYPDSQQAQHARLQLGFEIPEGTDGDSSVDSAKSDEP